MDGLGVPPPRGPFACFALVRSILLRFSFSSRLFFSIWGHVGLFAADFPPVGPGRQALCASSPFDLSGFFFCQIRVSTAFCIFLCATGFPSFRCQWENFFATAASAWVVKLVRFSDYKRDFFRFFTCVKPWFSFSFPLWPYDFAAIPL